MVNHFVFHTFFVTAEDLRNTSANRLPRILLTVTRGILFHYLVVVVCFGFVVVVCFVLLLLFVLVGGFVGCCFGGGILGLLFFGGVLCVCCYLHLIISSTMTTLGVSQ